MCAVSAVTDELDGQAAKHLPICGNGRQCVVVFTIVANEHAKRGAYVAGECAQGRNNIRPFIIDWNNDVEATCR